MEIYPTSVEYGTFTVAADADLDGTVQVTFLGRKQEPDDSSVWHAAEWVGPPARTRKCRLLLVGAKVSPVPAGGVQQVPGGLRRTWVRLPDNPEVIIRPGGEVTFY